MSERIIKIDSEHAVRRIAKLLPKWLAWSKRTGKLLEVVVREHEEKRRLKQNRCYWAVVTDIEDQLPALLNDLRERYTKRDLDLYFRQRYLGIESAEVFGKIVETLHEHKNLGVEDFSNYLTQVIVWAAEHDVVLLDETRKKISEVEKKAA